MKKSVALGALLALGLAGAKTPLDRLPADPAGAVVRYDCTEYADERPVAGLLLPMKRFGFAGNAKGKTGRKTNEILYEDVRFDVPSSPALFELPRGWKPPV